MKSEYVEKLENLSNIDRKNLIDVWISNERDRAILKRLLIDGLNYESLADEFDLSRSQIVRIVYKSEDRLFKHI